MGGQSVWLLFVDLRSDVVPRAVAARLCVRPKSAIRGVRESSSRTFLGFRSRWVARCSCRKSIAEAMGFGVASNPPRATRGARDRRMLNEAAHQRSEDRNQSVCNRAAEESRGAAKCQAIASPTRSTCAGGDRERARCRQHAPQWGRAAPNRHR
jgi:hypothetical protein